MRPFFKDLYDSGLTEKWFSLAGNALITAAAMVVWKEGSSIAGIIAVISYFFLATQATHGTRESYEHLKKIYVYPYNNRWHGSLLYALFFSFRVHIMFAPIFLIWWAYSAGKVPL